MLAGFDSGPRGSPSPQPAHKPSASSASQEEAGELKAWDPSGSPLIPLEGCPVHAGGRLGADDLLALLQLLRLRVKGAVVLSLSSLSSALFVIVSPLFCDERTHVANTHTVIHTPALHATPKLQSSGLQ